MTPAREKLLRLALAMPEAGVMSICRSIAWICPGIDDPSRPIMRWNAAVLLSELSTIKDKALLEQFSAELSRLLSEPARAPRRTNNVVSLFGGGEGPEAA